MPRFAFLDEMHLSKESDLAHEIGNAFQTAMIFLKLAADPVYAGNITQEKLAEREALIASFDEQYHAGFLPMRKRYRGGLWNLFAAPKGQVSYK